MRPLRVLSIVVGCLLALPAFVFMAGGTVVAVASAIEEDNDGYIDEGIDGLQTSTVAIVTDEIDFEVDPDTPGWASDLLEVDVRLQATGSGDEPIFVGIASMADVDAYLAGHAHEELIDVDAGPYDYRLRPGTFNIDAPVDQDFWVASASGPGDELTWETTSGRWAVVVMNADGSPGVTTDMSVGLDATVVRRAGVIAGLAGLVGVLFGTALIVGGALGSAPKPTEPPSPAGLGPIPPSPVHDAGAFEPSPVSLTAILDPGLSRWQWLVKWALAVPHFIIMVFLGIAFCVTTLVAAVAILFTGRYPRGLFDFNVGVLRWGWRTSYYASSGGLGTDRYPPFTLDDDPTYPARLDVAYPTRLNRPLVLVKWLLALPHALIVGLLVGGSVGWFGTDVAFVTQTGLLGVLVLAAAVVLAATGTYPRQLFDLIIGLNRWIYRAVAYVALMTDDYPPFRLDQGGTEPAIRPSSPSGPRSTLDLDPDTSPEDVSPASDVEAVRY